MAWRGQSTRSSGSLEHGRGFRLTPPDAGSHRVLVLNAGSSTLKASIVDVATLDHPLGRRDPRATRPAAPTAVTIEWRGDASRDTDIERGCASALEGIGLEKTVKRDPAGTGNLVAVAHRVVHGGARFTAPIRIDDDVLAAIDALASLAPLHNPIAASTIRAAQHYLPDIPHVAVFDTAFHAGLPQAARRYPVPFAWDGWGVRRYGFHGLSVEWSVERSSQLLDRPTEELGLVVAHLGNGCSVTAVRGGRSVATSMGMTPLEGLMMGTRAGSIDPGLILMLLRDGRLGAAALTEALEHESGLLGVSGTSSDMRELEAAAAHGDHRAQLAIEMFVDRAAAGIAGVATALPRLDALVFTGGIGENAAAVRTAIVDRLAVIGLQPIDPGAPAEDGILGGSGGGPMVLRVEAREDIVAARAAWPTIG